jgi:hypothetical protein
MERRAKPLPLTAGFCWTADPAHRFQCWVTIQAVEPRGWTNSRAGKLVMTSPDPHQTARPWGGQGGGLGGPSALN